MRYPKAYEPQKGYMYQILCTNEIEWEHCDYAVDTNERNYLIKEYQMAYGNGYKFKSITLPKKYWSK